MSEDDRRLTVAGDHGEPGGRDPLAEMLRAAGARPGVPQATAERLRDVVEAALAGKRARGRRTRGLRVLAAAASVVLIAFAVRYAPWPGAATAPVVAHVEFASDGAGATVGAAVAVGEEVSTGTGETLALLASMGHSIRLAPGTRARFTTPSNLELLGGAVYVDSGDGPSANAIAIETPFGRVEELGTRYQVSFDDSRLKIRVRDGSVVLERSAERHRADAGRVLTMDRDGSVSLEEAQPYGDGWEWVLASAAAPAIDGRPLGDLLDWVVRETGWVLEFDDPQTAARAPDIVLRGSVEGLSPEDALGAILPTCGLAHRSSSGKVLLGATQEN